MKQPTLENYTKQKKLYGQNQQTILDKFVQYAHSCCDPINIYKYMEEKSICIYLANYWTNRAFAFADIGDFRDALLCLKEAQSRNHIVKQNEVNIDEHLSKLKTKITTSIKRYPLKNKREATQYSLLYQTDKNITWQNMQSIIDLFERNYSSIKKQLQKQFNLKSHGKKQSWLARIEKENQQKIRKISEKIKTTSNQDFYSLRTPISKKDPMRLTKTMDSIEMLKKKKSTQDKGKKNDKDKFGENDQSAGNKQKKTENHDNNNDDDQDDLENDDQLLCINTTPVGRQLSILSRRVTFNTKHSDKFIKIQKIRGDSLLSDDNNSHTASQKYRDDTSIEKSKSISRRGSILKNKKIDYEKQGNAQNMEQQP